MTALNGGDLIEIYRLNTGTDGGSHIDEFKLADHPELSSLKATSEIMFLEASLGTTSTGIPPVSPVVIILSGRLEIGLGDSIQPGDAGWWKLSQAGVTQSASGISRALRPWYRWQNK